MLKKTAWSRLCRNCHRNIGFYRVPCFPSTSQTILLYRLINLTVHKCVDGSQLTLTVFAIGSDPLWPYHTHVLLSLIHIENVNAACLFPACFNWLFLLITIKSICVQSILKSHTIINSVSSFKSPYIYLSPNKTEHEQANFDSLWS